MNPIWFHCNRCGRNDQNVNILASCGHILCHQCFDCQSPICPIKTCKQNIRVKAIGPELMNDPDLAMLFQHGSDAVQKVGHSWQVQMSQFMHLVEHLTRVKNQKLAELEKADQTLKDLEAELASKRAWKEQEEKKIQLRSPTAAQFIQTTPEGSTISNRFSNEISTSFQSPYFNNPGTVDRPVCCSHGSNRQRHYVEKKLKVWPLHCPGQTTYNTTMVEYKMHWCTSTS